MSVPVPATLDSIATAVVVLRRHLGVLDKHAATLEDIDGDLWSIIDAEGLPT